ncbi:ERF superfamily protein [Thermoactinomyces sp. DSM 45891]|uniref:ERF family protein n=1 Tax=Thermoactinomyces sp. DSM 45891 TaxID=1761907 RepID=UPI000910DF3D|nr:ERF family protein [Thermoactinomyces sp. DSM 45891]SFX79111.1 ERF superfamily protein [Thermoactinomyces sp. DSM 45891]
MKFSADTKNIFPAMATFQSIVEAPKKTAENPYFKKKYADLQNVIDAIQPAIRETNLFYLTEVVYNDKGHIGVSIRICHESGEWILCDPIFMPSEAKNPQEVGIVRTYAIRYALATAFGLAGDVDDDANSVSGKTKEGKGQQSQKRNQPSNNHQQKLQPPKKQADDVDRAKTGRTMIGTEATNKKISKEERQTITKAEFGFESLTEVSDLNVLHDVLKFFREHSAEDLKELAMAHKVSQVVETPNDKPITDKEVDEFLKQKGVSA